MLELRPCCEHCAKPLPPASMEARICSFECTFCATCAEQLLAGICPNCGGDLVRRPIRPQRDWRGGNSLAHHPAGTTCIQQPADLAAHRRLVAMLADLPSQLR